MKKSILAAVLSALITACLLSTCNAQMVANPFYLDTAKGRKAYAQIVSLFLDKGKFQTRELNRIITEEDTIYLFMYGATDLSTAPVAIQFDKEDLGVFRNNLQAITAVGRNAEFNEPTFDYTLTKQRNDKNRFLYFLKVHDPDMTETCIINDAQIVFLINAISTELSNPSKYKKK